MPEHIIGFSGLRAVAVEPTMVASVSVVPNSNRVVIVFKDKAKSAVQIDAIDTKGPKGTALYVRGLTGCTIG